ncbi:MAG: SEC-C metal-binding domain-containing protein, partial [Candidatus Sulfotelmatobacter sp.]
MLRNDTTRQSNDPCPCGSGKKYKKCHGASVPPGADPIAVRAGKPKPPKSGQGAAAVTPDTEPD